jgi:hypothetical protein
MAADLDRAVGGDSGALDLGHDLRHHAAVFETGSDPTWIPVAAFLAPAAAAMLTALAGVIANVFRQGLGGG